MKGRLIVLEGMDYSGKSTQVKALAEALRIQFPDREVVTTRQPGELSIPFCVDIREILCEYGENITPNSQQLLMYADKLEHYLRFVAPALNRGAIVISDRWFYSAFVYYKGPLNLPELASTICPSWESSVDVLFNLCLDKWAYDERKNRETEDADDIHSMSYEELSSRYNEMIGGVSIDANRNERTVTRTMLNYIMYLKQRGEF